MFLILVEDLPATFGASDKKKGKIYTDSQPETLKEEQKRGWGWRWEKANRKT